MNRNDVTEILARPLCQQLMASGIPARLAYTGLDGDPRVIPIGFLWTGSTIELYTIPASAKVGALRANPRVAVTIDTQGFPPNILLVRGSASLELVGGVPDGYVEATRKLVPPEQMAGWEAGVRALYEEMVVISITPDWAKLMDFVTTIPKAVEDLVRAHGDPR